MYIEFLKYIKNIDNSQFEKYNNNRIPNGYELEGTRRKKFVRFNSNVFSELIEEVRNNRNSSYDTYMNDVIKSGHTPEYLSVMKKELPEHLQESNRFGMGYLNEVCASRIMNFFECPTTYDTLLNINNSMYLCSVDFGRYGEEFFELRSILPHKEYFEGTLSCNLNFIKPALEKLDRMHFLRKNNNSKEKFIEDFIYSYLIRLYILNDIDYDTHNIGVLYDNKNKTYRMAPNYDFEYVFDFDFYDEHIPDSFEMDMRFVKSKNKHIYDKFTDKVSEFLSIKSNTPVFQEIITSVIGNDKHAKEFLDIYSERLEKLKRKLNFFESELKNEL